MDFIFKSFSENYSKKTINFRRRVALLNQERNLFCEHCSRDEKTIQLLRSLGRKLNLTSVDFSQEHFTQKDFRGIIQI